MKLTKSFRIEMAHRLMQHEGRCRNLHGHSYQIEFSVTGYPQNGITAPNDGMITDFSVLKNAANYLSVIFDHSLCLQFVDPIVADFVPEEALRRFPPNLWKDEYLIPSPSLNKFQQKLVLVRNAPTAENLATVWLRQMLYVLRPWHPTDASILVRETCTSAVYMEACELRP